MRHCRLKTGSRAGSDRPIDGKIKGPYPCLGNKPSPMSEERAVPKFQLTMFLSARSAAGLL